MRGCKTSLDILVVGVLSVNKLVAMSVTLPWVPETFLARFPVSIKSL